MLYLVLTGIAFLALVVSLVVIAKRISSTAETFTNIWLYAGVDPAKLSSPSPTPTPTPTPTPAPAANADWAPLGIVWSTKNKFNETTYSLLALSGKPIAQNGKWEYRINSPAMAGQDPEYMPIHVNDPSSSPLGGLYCMYFPPNYTGCDQLKTLDNVYHGITKVVHTVILTSQIFPDAAGFSHVGWLVQIEQSDTRQYPTVYLLLKQTGTNAMYGAVPDTLQPITWVRRMLFKGPTRCDGTTACSIASGDVVGFRPDQLYFRAIIEK